MQNQPTNTTSPTKQKAKPGKPIPKNGKDLSLLYESDDAESFALKESTIISKPLKGKENKKPPPKKKAKGKQPLKRSKSSTELTSAKPKKKRVRKKAYKPYQKGQFNTLVEVVSFSKVLNSLKDEVFNECCVQCNNRNVIRAARNDSLPLMIKCIEAVSDISNLYSSWISDYPASAFRYALINNNREMITALVQNEFNAKKPQRCKIERPKIALSDAGENSQFMVGVRTRKLNTTRGNKMGNNALLMDDPNPFTPFYSINLCEIVMTKCTDPSLIDFLSSVLVVSNQTTFYSFNCAEYISRAARVGNRVMAAYMLQRFHKESSYGFNSLHSDVLNLPTPELQVKVKTSLTKKPQTNEGMTPMHLVCINPDTRYLERMIELGADWNILDLNNRKPLHYAAACEDSGPLYCLLTKGALIDEGDKSRKTALMIACECGREKNVALLIEKGANLQLKQYKPPNYAIHYATKEGHLGVVKLLLDTESIDIDTQGEDRMTPLMMAAFYGHYDLALYLLERGAKVIKKDKFRRTALLHTCRSGQTVIASVLLSKGSEYMLGDSSKNTPLHYACAYGWIEIVKLLIKAGANPNEENMWRITPMEIAFLKNHFRIVKYLLNTDLTNVNTKFNRDMTLLHYAFSKLNDKALEEIHYLIYDKKANVNLQNYDGDSCFHYLARFSYAKYKQENADLFSPNKDMSPEELDFIHRPVHRSLLQNVFKLLNTQELEKELVNNDGRSALHLAFEVGNIPFIEEIAEMNLKLTFRDKTGHNLLHLIPRYVFGSEEESSIVMNILAKAKLIEEGKLDALSNAYDCNGFTPFLELMLQYSKQIKKKQSDIYAEVRYSLQKTIHEGKDIEPDSFEPKEEIKADGEEEENEDDEGDEDNEEGDEGEEEEKHANKKRNKMRPLKSMKSFAPRVNIFQNPFGNELKPLHKNKREIDQSIRKISLSKVQEKEVLENAKEKFEEFLSFFQQIIEAYEGLKCSPSIKVGKKAEYRIDALNKKRPPIDKALSKNKRIEMKYFSGQGKKSALMYLMAFPYEGLLSYFLDTFKLDVNEISLYRQNALFFLIEEMNTSMALHSCYTSLYAKALRKLIAKGANVNQSDSRSNTLFYLLSKKWDIDMMNMLLKSHADVNKYNQRDENALLYYVRAKSLEKTRTLIEDFNCDVNYPNAKKRTVMHYLYNDEVASTNTDDSLSEYLLSLKPAMNVYDISHRAPLHYLFIKIGKEFSNDIIDPINSLVKLIEHEGIDLSPVDVYGNTPLHYAAQRGATISLLTLLANKVNIDAENAEKNTALCYAIMFNQQNIAILLIQQHAAINAKVYQLLKRDEDEIVKQIKRELEQKQSRITRSTQVDIYSSDLNSSMNSALSMMDNVVGQRVGNEQVVINEDEKEEDISEEEELPHKDNAKAKDNEDDEEDSDDSSFSSYCSDDNDNKNQAYAQPPATSNNPFFRNKYATKIFNRNTSTWNDAYPQQSQLKQQEGAEQLNTKFFHSKKERERGLSLFRIIIRQNFQGLTYLFLTSGFDLMRSIEDCFYESIFNLAMQLLKRSNKPNIYTMVNQQEQNLFHILGKISLHKSPETLKPFFNMLASKSINIEHKDAKGNTPLHYASKNHFVDFCKFILAQKSRTKLLAITNNKNQTPFALAIIKHSIASAANCYQMLFDKSTVSVKYLDKSYEDDYRLTPLLHVVRKSLEASRDMKEFQLLCEKIINLLLSNGASVMEKDSKGKDCLMYCVIENNLGLLQELISTCKPELIQRNASDSNKKTLMHFCTSLNEEGSYENKAMLTFLIENGFDALSEDYHGLTPLNYVMQQRSGVNLSVFKSYRIGDSESFSVLDYKREEEEEFTQIVDYEKDSATLFQMKESELLKEPKKIKPNLRDYHDDTFELYHDDTFGYWNASCTKVNIQNGIYGENMFYFIQLVHDKGKQMYIVTTQFGRIGEEGANQRSPFHTLEEAQADFKKVFKSKTGNMWENIKSFAKQKGKYMLLQFDEVQLDHKELLKPIDYSVCLESKIPNDEVKGLMKDITDSSIYFKALKDSGINTDTFKFSMLNKALILKAKDIMLEIIGKLNRLEVIDKAKRKSALNSVLQPNEVEEITDMWNKIFSLSSSYYELIPKTQFAQATIRPVSNLDTARQEIMLLNNLSYVEKAVNILLGAQFKQNDMNPLDYVYNALNIHISLIDKQTVEFGLIERYIKTTQATVKVSNLFRLNRKGETESIRKWDKTTNHFLLFHGTKVFNFIGIFSNGLKIAPPEAPVTGYMFGKGLYFADMFSKSINYCDTFFNKEINKNRSYMLICEVVLGNSFCSYVGEDQELEFLNKGYKSLKSQSVQVLDENMNFVMNNGVIIPLGKVVQNKRIEKGNWNNKLCPTQDTEYVIYDTSQVKLRYLVQIES